MYKNRVERQERKLYEKETCMEFGTDADLLVGISRMRKQI